MNKTQIIEQIAGELGLTLADVERVLNSFFNLTKESLKTGVGLNIRNFGSFEKVKFNSRKGRNPQTGEELVIPERNVAKFKPSKELKDLVNS
jgi:DNA-binding protein HU-beta